MQAPSHQVSKPRRGARCALRSHRPCSPRAAPLGAKPGDGVPPAHALGPVPGRLAGGRREPPSGAARARTDRPGAALSGRASAGPAGRSRGAPRHPVAAAARLPRSAPALGRSAAAPAGRRRCGGPLGSAAPSRGDRHPGQPRHLVAPRAPPGDPAQRLPGCRSRSRQEPGRCARARGRRRSSRAGAPSPLPRPSSLPAERIAVAAASGGAALRRRTRARGRPGRRGRTGSRPVRVARALG